MKHGRNGLALCLLALCVACSEPEQAALTESAEDAPPKTQSFDVQWFDGNTEQAFAAAKELNKPLFLYWGAKWCPPCHELKATVFNEPGFVQKSRQFIAVYLDGDSPGAQQQAERFKVMGYPTLVVFNSASVELTRIPNGLDLAAYATVLDSVLENLRPVGSLLQQAVAGKALTVAQCQAVAQHSWGQNPDEMPADKLVPALADARQQCPAASRADHSALLLRQLIVTHKEDLPFNAEQRLAAKQQLAAVFAQPELLESNFYLFLDAGEPLTALLGENEQPDTEVLGTFRQRYEQMASDQQQSLFNRIQVSRALYALQKKYASTKQLTQANLALTAQAQQMQRSDPKFHATMNAAGNLLRESGELVAARNLLAAESEKSKYGYYFMSELAHIEQLLGNNAEALSWLQKAHQQSRGPATRFQWGVGYLNGLLELDASNLAGIEQSFKQVFAELPADSVMYQRSRVRLSSLQEALQEWSAADSSRKKLHQQLNEITSRYLSHE